MDYNREEILLEKYCAGQISLEEYVELNEDLKSSIKQGVGTIKSLASKAISKLKSAFKKTPKLPAAVILALITIAVYKKFSPALAKKVQDDIKKKKLDISLRVGAFGDESVASKERAVTIASLITRLGKIPTSIQMDAIVRGMVAELQDLESGKIVPKTKAKRDIAFFHKGKLSPRDEFKQSDVGGAILDLKKQGAHASEIFSEYARIKPQLTKELLDVSRDDPDRKLKMRTITAIHKAVEQNLYNYLVAAGIMSLKPEKDYAF